jgi:HD-GYP domain-containing protein (c-di-GMP phosphodiesterase class II)
MLVERAGAGATPDDDGQVAAVGGLLDAHVGRAKGHSQRLAGWADAIARALTAPEPEVRAVRCAAFLLDIGKVDVPQTTLQKAAGLTPDEQALLDREAAVAYQILKDVQGLGAVAAILQHRFEHWSGAGRPGGLKGDAIPLGARILAIVGVYSEMIAGRPGVPQLYYRDAIAAINRGSGKRFDPKVVAAFSKIVAGG